MITSETARAIATMRYAEGLAKLSKCIDRGVAAIITDRSVMQVYSIGINGGAKGSTQCLCELGKKYTCIHAEANAIAKCMSTDPDKTVFCTLAPCVTCAALLYNNGVTRLFFVDEYKDMSGVQMLQDLGVEVIQFKREEATNGHSD